MCERTEHMQLVSSQSNKIIKSDYRIKLLLELLTSQFNFNELYKLNLRKVTIYLLTSCNTKVRIAQNIYIHNSNRNYKKLATTTILIEKRIGIGYKNYRKQCPELKFRLIPKLISWAGAKAKKFKNSSWLI